MMKKQFRSTFWSIETGNEWIQSFFLRGGGDEIKKNILEFNQGKWKAIEPQVKEWVAGGWLGWERDKPGWFTDNWKARVPEAWVPREGKAGWNVARRNSLGAAGGAGRKKSIMYENALQLGMAERGSAEAVRKGSSVQPVMK